MKRRDFVKCMGHTVAIPTILGSFGFHNTTARALQTLMKSASEEGRILVMIYLQGGNDGLNTVIPLEYFSELNQVRPEVVLKESSLSRLSKSNLAFHPSLDGFKSLYDEDRLVVIQNVGYPEQNFSHFRSTDIWQSASDSNKIVDSGWIGRYLTEQHEEYPEAYPNESFPDPLAIEFGNSNSLLFQGEGSTMSMVINDPDSFYNLLDDVESPAPETPAGDRLKFIRIIAKQSQLYGQVVKNAAEKAGDQVDYPDTDLGNQLRIVGRLISGGLKTPIFKVQVRGFDTHSDQVLDGNHGEGTHSELLKELNDGVLAFMKDLEKMGRADDVVGLTYSEFGRRIVSNASLGTDHGAAAPVFVFGNKVAGGTMGTDPVIDSSMTPQDNLEAEFDFRQVYSSLMEQWFESDSSQISNTMLKDFDTLPIIEQGKTEVLRNRNALSTFSVYPNPLNGMATIRLLSDSSPIKIELMDVSGRVIEKIYYGDVQPGQTEVSWNTHSLKEGRYFVVLTQNNTQKVKSVVK
ncbi:MAG: DUF1501 domain-containing protein [Cyclobacteriaceae bacterium]